jgi:hypothetical protein
MATQIQLRRDTATNWTANNPILAECEIGIETDGLGTDTVLKKIGNGVDNWSTLPYESTGGGGGAVDSVNGKNGVVVLDTGDIPSVTDKKYVTDAEKTVIGNTSNTNTGDQKTIEGYPTSETTAFTVPDGSDRKWIECDFTTDQNVTVTTTSITEEGEVIYLEQLGTGKITLIGVTADGSGSVSSIGVGDVVCVVKKPLSLKKI